MQQIKKKKSQDKSNDFNLEKKSYSEKTRVGEFIWQACHMSLIHLNKSMRISLVTNSSDSFTNFVTNESTKTFYENECCY